MERKWFSVIIALIFILLIYKSANITTQSTLPIRTSWDVTLKNGGIYYLGEPFQINSIEFTCTNAQERVISKQECFQIDASYRGDSFTFNGKDTKFINPYISVQYLPDAQVRIKDQDAIDREWKFDHSINKFKFTMEDSSFFDTMILSADKQYGTQAELLIKNKLANDLKGGLELKYKPSIINTEFFETTNMSLKFGDNLLTIPLKSDIQGFTTVEMIPFVVLDSDYGLFRIYGKEKQFTYGVSPNMSINNQTSSLYVQPKSEFPLAIVLVIVGLIVLLFLAVRKDGGQ